MKLEQQFSKYLANLSVLTMKLHNLHWNVEGAMFVPVHEYTDGEYNKFFERMDEVAELFKMFGHTPKSTLKEYLEIATIVEEPTRKFACNEAMEIYLKDLEMMRQDATELRNAADGEGWFSAVALLESHIEDYNKQIWFIKAMLA